MLYWIAGPVAPGGGAGKLDRNQSTTISERMIVPTRREEDARALPQPEREVAQVRPAVGRQLEHQRLQRSAAGDPLEHAGHRHRRGDAGDVEAEQRQAAQVEDAQRARAGMKAPMSSA